MALDDMCFPTLTYNEDQRKLAQRLLKEGKSVREVARTFSVHPATLYRIVAPSP